MKSNYELLIKTIKRIGRVPKGYDNAHYDIDYTNPVLGFETDTPQDDILNISQIMCDEFRDDMYSYEFDCLDDILKYLNMFNFDYGEDVVVVHFNDIPFQKPDGIKVNKTDDELLDEIIQFDDAKRYRWLRDKGYLDEHWWLTGENRILDIDQNIDKDMFTLSE